VYAGYICAGQSRKRQGGNPSNIAGSTPAIHPDKVYATVWHCRPKRQLIAPLGAESIRYPAKNVSNVFGCKGIPSNGNPALSENGYRTWKKKVRKRFSADSVPALKVSAAE